MARAIIDTNVAICLRDGDSDVAARLSRLDSIPMISVLTRVELEGGVYRDLELAPIIRPRLDLLLQQFDELPFTTEEAKAYGKIVEHCGYSRPRTIDRMIAATAIVAGATLITLNPADFRAIPNLVVVDWTAREQ
jgi:predicted nucleic acid-binding protein